jgi:hypothetical protein
VWCADDFKDCKNDEERDELAWIVPPERGIFNVDYVHNCDDPEEAAQKFADVFHDEREGNECTWPIVFIVHDGEKYFRVSVDRDYQPVFICSDPEEFTP